MLNFNLIKMKIKNLLSFIIAIIFAVSFVSCGGGSTEKAAENKDTKSEVAQTQDFSAGQAIYEGKGNCHTCHQKTGLGVAGTFPPLANSDYLLADKARAVKQTIYGSKEPIVVNGTTYPGKIMTLVSLSDQEVVDVVNYILNTWGNKAGTVTLDDVKKAR